ncbi:Na/Pi symporter [uncultured Paraglaciecola sp.]|uniref:Na/Pi cotransporter family protein n=1 Tax=uncultured Paraglaciecola sp. TaxID=1765024 RepID=UPI0030D85683|tara:strand:+ start:126890 stop:128545 length:1656 start_codon:yes stop_codon:yes gene_type:complete
MQTITLIGTILGGLGLFLLAIAMMTDGLKLAAGTSLRKLLSESSRTPLRGIFSGCFMTAIVQSSSAVTVASLGFVNAGLISMRQALGIVYGANIGTTMTGWLVALLGFKFDIQAFALPMVGAGMILKMVKQKGKLASFGLALVGFGLFFIGIDVLKNAFEGLVQTFNVSEFTAEGISGIFTFLLVGIVMTMLTQSSSASIALTITAASTGVVGIYAAGAMVIGANIGTTSTALLASIGATPNAKRVAAAQVIFNSSTALVALVIMPVIFYLIDGFTQFFTIRSDAAISLALFHSIFNVLGVVLVYPHNDRLATFLEGRFHAPEEKDSRPQYLDNTIAQTPVLAVNALLLENLALSEKVMNLYSKSIQTSASQPFDFENEVKIIKLLSTEISKFIANIGSSEMSEDTTADLATLLRIEQYFLSCTITLEHIVYQFERRESFAAHTLEQDMTDYLAKVATFMQSSRGTEFGTLDMLQEQISQLHSEHDKLKAKLLIEGTRSHISISQMSDSIDGLAEVFRLAQQWNKALIRIKALQGKLDFEDRPVPDVVADE